MSVAKVMTSSGWQDLQVVGPQGPQGPPGTPNGLHFAGISPGTIIAPADGQSGSFTNANCPLLINANNAGTIPFKFTVTPTVDCWWELRGQFLCRLVDAIWARLEGRLRLMDAAGTTAKADALGQYFGPVSSRQHHSGTADWTDTVEPFAIFALTAGQTYTCQMIVQATNAGTWVLYRDAPYTQFWNLGARPRY